MAAVTFYRFAAAIMEMLEPEKYNFTRNLVNNSGVDKPISVQSAVNQTNPLNETNSNSSNVSDSLSNNSIIAGTKSLQASQVPTDGVLPQLFTLTTAVAQLPGEQIVNPPLVENKTLAADSTELTQLTQTDNRAKSQTEILTATTASQAAVKEAVTVQVVAAQLTQAIANASEEKLAQVAQAIKEAAVETAPTATPTTDSAALTQTLANATTAAPTTKAEAVDLVQSTIKTLATETTKEIVQTSIAQTTLSSAASATAAPVRLDSVITPSVPDESNKIAAADVAFQPIASTTPIATTTTVVTSAITEKIKEKVAQTNSENAVTNQTPISPASTEDKTPIDLLLQNKIESTQPSVSLPNLVQEAITSTPNKEIAAEPETFKQPTDFWELFPEIDPSEIKYYDVVSYLYDYMRDGNLLGILNPFNDLNEKYGMMNFVSMAAGDKRSWEDKNIETIQKNRYENEERLREQEREARETEQRLSADQQRWEMQKEQQKLAVRIAEERMKNLRQ